MIIDSHIYCFEALDSARGYSSPEEHLKWAQACHASHQQPAMRIPDGLAGPSEILDPIGNFRAGELPAVGFGIDRKRGRVTWEWQGREYTKYFMPPNQRKTMARAM